MSIRLSKASTDGGIRGVAGSAGGGGGAGAVIVEALRGAAGASTRADVPEPFRVEDAMSSRRDVAASSLGELTIFQIGVYRRLRGYRRLPYLFTKVVRLFMLFVAMVGAA